MSLSPRTGNPYFLDDVSSEAAPADYGKLVSLVSNFGNTVTRENPAAVAFNATRYFASGLYGSPEIDEQSFEALYVSRRPDLKGKWREGMRYFQADMLVDDARGQELMGMLTGENIGSALTGALLGGFADPINVAFLGMSGVGGIARGRGILATAGRASQRVGRFVAPDAAAGANVGTRMVAGARQGAVEYAVTEPATFMVQDQYLNQEREAVELLISAAASVALPVGMHALARRVGTEPAAKRDAALKVPLIQRELDPSAVDPEVQRGIAEGNLRWLDRQRAQESNYLRTRGLTNEAEVQDYWQNVILPQATEAHSSSQAANLRTTLAIRAAVSEKQAGNPKPFGQLLAENGVNPAEAARLGELDTMPSANTDFYRGIENQEAAAKAPQAQRAPATAPLSSRQAARLARARQAELAETEELLTQNSVSREEWTTSTPARAPDPKTGGMQAEDRVLNNLLIAVEKWSGRKIRFYNNDAAGLFQSPYGAATLSTPDTIYINGESQGLARIIQTVGHELYHTLVYKNPKLARQVEQVVLKMKSLDKSLDASLSDWGDGWSRIPVERRIEELTANTVGQMFGSPEFWDRLAKEMGRSGFEKFRAYVLRRLSELRQLFGMESVGRQHVNDLFDSVYTAMSKTKDSEAFFKSPQALLAYRKNHSTRMMPVWRQHIDDAFARVTKLDEEMDRVAEDFSVYLPDEAGDTEVNRPWHNGVQFSRTGISIKLDPEERALLDRNGWDRPTLQHVLRTINFVGNEGMDRAKDYMRTMRRNAVKDSEPGGPVSEPMFAWKSDPNNPGTLYLHSAKAPKSGVSKGRTDQFSHAYARASELLSKLSMWFRDYEGANWKGSNYTDVAEALSDVATYFSRTLAGAEPLPLKGGARIAYSDTNTPGELKYLGRAQRNTGDPMPLEDGVDPITDEFFASREFERMFAETMGGETARPADPQTTANLYYAGFIEAIQAFRNRKMAELQNDMDPDLLANFEAWQDRVKEFHADSGKFTALDIKNYELQASAEARTPVTQQAVIEQAFRDMEAYLKEARGTSPQVPSTPRGLKRSGSVTAAMNELRAAMADATGGRPYDFTPVTLIDRNYDVDSAVPRTLQKFYMDSGLTEYAMENYPTYAGDPKLATMRALWDDLTTQDADNPMSLYADRLRNLEQMMDDLDDSPNVTDQTRYDQVRTVVNDLKKTLDKHYAGDSRTVDGITDSSLRLDAIEVLENLFGEAETARFLNWRKADLYESFDPESQATITAREEGARTDTSFEDPRTEAYNDDAFDQAEATDEWTQRSAESGERGFGSATMDTMPARPEFKGYDGATAKEISDRKLKDYTAIRTEIEAVAAANPKDTDLQALLSGVAREESDATLRMDNAKAIFDPARLQQTLRSIRQGVSVHMDNNVNDIIRSAFARSGGNDTQAIEWVMEATETHNASRVFSAALDAQKSINLRATGGTLAELKTLFDGVARITDGFFAKAGFQNVTRPVHGSVDADMKQARVEAAAEIQSAINALPLEARVSPQAGATALKAIVGAGTAKNTDPAFKRVWDAMQAGIEYSRARMNRAGATVAKLPNFLFSQKHATAKIEADLDGWRQMMLVRSDWNKIADRTGDQRLRTTPRVREQYLEGMLRNLRNAEVETDMTAFDINKDNLATRDRFHRTHEFKSMEDQIDYDMAYGSGDSINEVVNQIARRTERAVAMEHFGPSYADNMRRHLIHLRSQEPPAKGKRAKLLQDWSYARARHTFEHLTGTLNNPVNQRVAALGQTVRMMSSAAFGWMTTPSSVTDMANMKATLRSFGAQRHFGFIQGLTDFANNLDRIPQAAKTMLEANGAAYSTHLSSAARGDTEYAGKGFSRRGNDMVYTYNLQRRWVRTMQTAFTDIYVRHLADVADRLNKTGVLDEDFARHAEFYGMTPDELRTASQAIQEVDMDGSGTKTRVLMPAEIKDPAIRRRFQRMLIDTMDHAVLQPSSSDTAFLTFGTRAGTVTGEIVRTMMQFKGFTMAMNVRLRRRYRAYGMSDLEINKMNLDRVIHGAQLLAMGLLATQIKDVLNGKEPLHFMEEEQWTANNVKRVFGQAGMLSALSDLGLDPDRPGQALLGPAIGHTVKLTNRAVSDAPNAGPSFMSALLQGTPFSTVPLWNPLKHELFGEIFSEAYQQHRDAIVARQESLTGQTQLIN